MNITTVLFDLDGTLLPMDQDVFVKDYFSRLARKLAPYGYEPKYLEKREELLVAGTAMELMEDEAHCEMLLELVFEAMQDQLHAALHEYAEQHGRDTDALTEEEIAAVVDQFADAFLSRVMNLLLRVQQVPEILQLSRSASAAEDLVKIRSVNYDLINHDRRWNHQCTQTGPLIPLTPEMEASLSGDYSKTIKEVWTMDWTPWKATRRLRNSF